MKITIERKEKVEVEVQLPYYSKTTCHYFKIEENKTTCIYYPENTKSFGIEFASYQHKYPFDYEQTTEEEFNKVLQIVKLKMIEL